MLMLLCNLWLDIQFYFFVFLGRNDKFSLILFGENAQFIINKEISSIKKTFS